MNELNDQQKALSKGRAIVETGWGAWSSFVPGKPETVTVCWASTISKEHRPRVLRDKAAVAALNVGEKVTVLRSTCRRKGIYKETEVRRTV